MMHFLRSAWYLESQIGIAAHPSRRRGACHRARIRATRWRPPQDEVQLVETQQPHAEERATRASRSMGSKRPTDLSWSVPGPSLALQAAIGGRGRFRLFRTLPANKAAWD